MNHIASIFCLQKHRNARRSTSEQIFGIPWHVCNRMECQRASIRSADREVNLSCCRHLSFEYSIQVRMMARVAVLKNKFEAILERLRAALACVKTSGDYSQAEGNTTYVNTLQVPKLSQHCSRAYEAPLL